ncbi:hypothetical protein DYGSA30_20090 [Dyella sp. GSA-30]|nr:hypothetical protein DYGSA30_20090 [Dyella sp. GSA-30]
MKTIATALIIYAVFAVPLKLDDASPAWIRPAISGSMLSQMRITRNFAPCARTTHVNTVIKEEACAF